MAMSEKKRAVAYRDGEGRDLPLSRQAHDLALELGITIRKAFRLLCELTQGEVAEWIYSRLDPDDCIVDKRVSEAERWPTYRTHREPRHDVVQGFALLYGTSVAELYSTDEIAMMDPRRRLALGLAEDPTTCTAVVARDRDYRTHYADDDFASLESLLARDEAHSRRSLELAEMNNITDYDLDSIEAGVRDLARRHLYVNSTELARVTIRLRNHVNDLLDGIQPPRTRARLLICGAILTAMLADTNMSIGAYNRALGLANVAYEMALRADHTAMMRWSRGILASSIAYHLHGPSAALRTLGEVAHLPASKSERVNEVNSVALYQASLNHHDAARDALAQVDELNEQRPDRANFLDDMGGMFAYPEEKQLQVQATTWLMLNDFTNAERAADQALRRYEARGPHQRAFGNEAAARIDLARARHGGGNLDGAIETVEPVFGIEPARRQAWFVDRLESFRLEMNADPNINTSTAVVEISDAIEAFAREVPALKAL